MDDTFIAFGCADNTRQCNSGSWKQEGQMYFVPDTFLVRRAGRKLDSALTRLLTKFNTKDHGVAFAGGLYSACESELTGESPGNTMKDVLAALVTEDGQPFNAGPLLKKSIAAEWDCCGEPCGNTCDPKLTNVTRSPEPKDGG